MAEISVGEAAGAGLRLIRREPMAVLGWAALNLAVSVVMMAMLGGMIGQLAAVAARPEPDTADLLGLQMQMMGLQPLASLGGIVLQTVLMGAVFRAVLQPEERRWAYLRLSAQELWLGLVTVVISFGLGVGVMLLILPLAGIAAFVGFAFRETLGVGPLAVMGIVAVLAVVSAVVWLMLRLCMAYPMSFSDRNFRLFESWLLTRGHAGSLFLMFLLAMLAALAIQLVGFLIGVGALVASIGPNWRALLAGDPFVLLRAGAPLMALFVVVYSLASALTAAVTIAPLAEAYRRLRAPDAA